MKLNNFYKLAVFFLFVSCSFPLYPPQDKPFICITFDDEYQSVYDNALPIMNEFGFSATNFINTGLLGNDGKYDWNEVEEMEFVYGWETGGHTVHHITMPNYSLELVENEIRQDWQNLKNHNVSHESFALPSGAIAEEHIPLILKYFKNIRSSRDLKLSRPIDRTYLGYYSFDSSFSPEDMIARIIRGVENDEDLIILGFHKVAEDDGGFSANCPPNEFETIMRWICENNFKVFTLREALRKLCRN